jgi:flagellar biosynthesis anti-sigma factor FlgM
VKRIMRIDTSFTNPAVSNEKAARPFTPAASSGRTELKDEARLTAGKASVSALASQVKTEPEIRSEKVESLRAAIINGTYALNSQATADAMFNELF